MDIYATLTPLDLIIVFLVTIIGAALQGSVGYGMGLVVSPILILIEPKLIPGPFVVAAALLVFSMLRREKHGVDFSGLKWLIAGSIPGMVAGGLLLSRLPQNSIITLFGILILIAVAMSVSGWRLPMYRWILMLVGSFAGFMGIMTTINGPPIALVYQGAQGARLRATMAGYFISGTITSILTLIPIGRFGIDEIMLSLLLIPGTALGYFFSSRILPWVDRGYTRPFILSLSAVVAVFILIRQAWLLY